MLESAPKRFVSGETLPYSGPQRPPGRAACGRAVPGGPLRSLAVPGGRCRRPWEWMTANATSLFAEPSSDGISDRAAERLPDVVGPLVAPAGPEARSRAILIQRPAPTLGKLCSPDGTLRFNWRSMMLKSASLIEYVVVHELAHLTHRNHSSDYWDLVSRVMPDAQQRRRSLREEGRRLPL